MTVVSQNGSTLAGDFTPVSQNLSWGTTDSAAKTFTVTILDDATLLREQKILLSFSPVR